MRFGKYYDLTVGEIIKFRGFKGMEYLTWAYYRSSNISYMPEVLVVLGIIEENQIAKPGKVQKHELTDYMYKAMCARSENEEEVTEDKKLARGRMEYSRHINRKKAKKNLSIAWSFKYQNRDGNKRRNQGKYKDID